jgi:glycosyltransferase involved in cell wall biosynthesis
MRTAIIINSLIACGAERLALDEAHELYRRGEYVTLITLRPEKDGNSFMPLCTLPDSSRVFIHVHSLWDFRSWSALIKLLRKEKYDLVVTHLWFANVIGRIAARIASVPRILSFEHNVYDSVKTWRQFFADRVLQYISSDIIAVSNAVKESLIRHGIAAGRIAVVANGIDLQRYRDATPMAIDRKEEFTYLFVGRLVRQKGVDTLLSAFAKLKNGLLVITGDGVDRAALEKQSETLGISRRVRFLGVRDNVPSLMKEADCFVLPSRWEGMGIVLVEAMAAGCPVVVSDFQAARDIIEDGVSGLIVPIDNVEELAAAMQRMTDPALRARFVEVGSRSAERFSIGAHIDTLLAYAR